MRHPDARVQPARPLIALAHWANEAFAFVDFLAGAKQTYWQILPIGPTGYGDSPYQSFSAFAGNPYFIDYRLLVEQGFLIRGRAARPPACGCH